MGRYKAMRDVVVNNHLNESNDLSWVYAFSACSIESVSVFDDEQNIITVNNRFGTLDGEHDIPDLDSLFHRYAKFYRNADACLIMMKNAFNGKIPVVFNLYSFDGWACNCRAYPVFLNNKFKGMVLLADKERNGSKIRGKKGYCEQFSPTY